VAAPAAGLSPGQIRQAQRNALNIAFLSEGERQSLLAGKLRGSASSQEMPQA
jgi:adenosine deaminase